MSNPASFPVEGGCDCREVRYRMEVAPLIVHCCHCRWCQRESGSAFALNALVERGRVAVLSGAPELVQTPTASGRGQLIARCPTCRVAVWSHYGSTDDGMCFVRVGTLDNPDACPPDVHLYVGSRQSWVALPAGSPAHEGFYDPRAVWGVEGMARYKAARAQPGG